MKLREWQKECIDTALDKYLSGYKHFLALATPGVRKKIYYEPNGDLLPLKFRILMLTNVTLLP
jgi:hypothetical protein